MRETAWDQQSSRCGLTRGTRAEPGDPQDQEVRGREETSWETEKEQG